MPTPSRVLFHPISFCSCRKKPGGAWRQKPHAAFRRRASAPSPYPLPASSYSKRKSSLRLEPEHAKGGCGPPFGIPQQLTLAMKLPWHYRVGAHPPDASLTCVWVRKNEEADSVQTDSLHSASRASRKAPHPLLRFSSQNRNDVSVLKGRAAERMRPRVYTGAASEAARCAPFPRQARKLRICSRLLPDPPESLRWIPSEMRGRERARSDADAGRLYRL